MGWIGVAKCILFEIPITIIGIILFVTVVIIVFLLRLK